MDQDLITYLDRRFEETHQQIAVLRQETNQRFEKIDQRFEKIDQRFEKIDQRFEKIDQRFEKIDQRFDQVDEKIRHTNVMVEDLRSDLKAVAEGLVTLDGRLERTREEMDQGLRETQSLIRLSYTQLERRIVGLETSVTQLDARVTALEAARA